MDLSNIAILDIKGTDYCCIISGIGKSEAIKIKRNIDLVEKSTALYNIKFIITYKNG